MSETAVILSAEGEIAKVQIERSKSCSQCGACSIGRGNKMTGQAINKVGAKKGDMVAVELKGSVVNIAAIVYLLPLVMFFSGYWIFSKFVSKQAAGESAGIIGALLFLVISYFFVVLYDRNARKKGTCLLVIKKILRRGNAA